MSIIQTLKKRKRRFYRSLAIGLFVSAWVPLASYSGLGDDVEAKALEFFFSIHGARSSPAIVIVDIDDKAFQRLGEREPLPRSYLASLIDFLSKSGAKVIGYDIELVVPTNPRDDAMLLKALQRASENDISKVVLSYALTADQKGATGSVSDTGLLFSGKVTAVAGFFEADFESGVVRQLPLASRGGDGKIHPSLALAIVARYSGYTPARLEKELNDNDPIVLRLAEWDRWHRRFLAERTPFRFEKEDQWKINFVGSFAKFPSEKVFDFAKQNTPIAADNVFRDKIVLLGVSHRASHDFHLTPKGKMTGVEIHANAVHTILSRSQIRGAHRVAALAIAMMFALIASVLFTLYDPLAVKIASYVAIPVIALPVSYWSLVHAGIWLDLLTPLMAIRLASDIADFREQRLIKRTLGEFVDQEVAKHLVEEEDSLAHAQEVSVLFTNVRNLTTLAEQSRPAKAIAMMNQLFSMIDEVIKKYQGSIINFAGDGVFAVFGAPKANLSHARSAVQAALEIYDRTHALNRQWNERDLPSLKITVGIHTGEALAGVAGLGARKRYDVTGDTVSVGARVERLNEQFETSILVTEQTLKQLDAEVSVNECGEIKVVGDQRVKVFEVLQAPSQWRF